MSKSVCIELSSIKHALVSWIANCFDDLYDAAREELKAKVTCTQTNDLLNMLSVAHIKSSLTDELWLILLGTRLNMLARYSLPDRQAPFFIEENTPELEPILSRLHSDLIKLDPSSQTQEVEECLTRGFSALGCSGLLLLMGQRRTQGTLSSALGIPPSSDLLYRSFNHPYSSGSALSVGARAFTKHAARSDHSWWGTPTGNYAIKNRCALDIAELILSRPTWWNTFHHYRQGIVFEAREPGGYGMRWGGQGARFIGFLEPFDEGRGGVDLF